MDENKLLDIKTDTQNADAIIKVIGVGGGGGNAVNHMYKQNIKDVSFLLCNTDRQHLRKCEVPNTICLGENITRGLGAGNKPEKAQQAAKESSEEIRKALSDGTAMVFITAGMGGGTGTGAAPIIAKIAKEMGLLTVGIVTIPFIFEGERKILQALKGVKEMSENVDAILVIQNELLRQVYPDLKISDAFQRADETLTTAARSISELITDEGVVNVDFQDVSTTLTNSGGAIISRGFGTGPNSLKDAIKDALDSPLVNTKCFEKASRVLLYFTYSKKSEPDSDVFMDLNSIMAGLDKQYSLIWGYGLDDSLDDKVRVTLLASGFKAEEETRDLINDEDRKIIDEYYGRDNEVGTTFRTETPVIFTDDELDNEEFTTFILRTPTLKRTEQQVEMYRKNIRPSAKLEGAERPLEPVQPLSSSTVTNGTSTDGLDNSSNNEEVDDELIIFGQR